MRIFIILILFSATVSAQIEPVLWKVEKDTILEWHYYFGDEFNGEEVNQELWHMKYPWGGLLADEGTYSDKKMVSQSNGLLKLSADTTSEWRSFPKWILETGGANKGDVEIRNGNEVELHYLTSAVWSKQEFKYGYFEARCMSPRGKGLWPAFWLYGGFPNEEIDFMEMKGEKPKQFHVDVHCPNDCNRVKTGWFGRTKRWGAWIKTNEVITEQFVVYSGLWKPGEIKMYLNGQEAATFKGDFKTNMSLIANLAVAQDGKAFGPGIDKKTKLPSDFYVDYIRVWHPLNGLKDVNRDEQLRFDEPIENSEIIQSSARVKRTKRIMRDKKNGKKHIGFISITQDIANRLLIEKNGIFKNLVLISLLDQNRNVLIQSTLENTQTWLDISGFKKGSYVLKLSYEDISSMVEITL